MVIFKQLDRLMQVSVGEIRLTWASVEPDSATF